MNDTRNLHLTDDLIRAALTKEPPLGLAEAVGRGLTIRLDTTPQRRHGPIRWPSSDPLPRLEPWIERLRPRGLGLAVALALLVLSSLMIAAVVGSLLPRRPAPFGLAQPGLIAFDLDGDVFTMDRDGGGLRQLTSGAASDLAPTWSLDGTMIAFGSVIPPEANVWPPDSTVEVVVMRPDGTDRRTIATLSANVSVYGNPYQESGRLAWSPDGRSIAYTALIGARPEIFVAPVDGTGAAQVGDPVLEGADPAWSPDGARIAFRGGSNDLDRGVYVMNRDGSGARRLSTYVAGVSLYSYVRPTWSPNGHEIAFARLMREEGLSAVWIVDVDTGLERMISPDDGDSQFPAWSPDGDRLAYMSYTSDTAQFVVAGADGSDPVVLEPFAGWAPTWSPDGRHLVGRNDDDGDTATRLVIIDIATGTAMIVLGPPHDPTSDDPWGLPSWQRLAD